MVFTDVLLNDLRDDFCVVLDDDFVMVFDDDTVVDDVREQVENTVSKTVREFIDECVRGYLDRDVEDCVLKTRATAAENHVAICVPEPVVRQVIDAVGD